LAVAGQTPPAPMPSRPEITDHYQTMLQYHRRLDATVPAQAVVFLGDSLTLGLCTEAVACPSVNYGIGSDTTVGVLGRLPHYRDSLSKASAVVLAIGVNDLMFREGPELAQNYGRILQALPQGLRIVCSALLPIHEEIYRTTTRVNNRRIREVNQALRELSAKDPRCVFVDAGSQLVDAKGELKAEFQDGDGIHLNPAGNRIWIEALRSGLGQPRASGTPAK
jgi:lysophospholipase L1-like esterase